MYIYKRKFPWTKKRLRFYDRLWSKVLLKLNRYWPERWSREDNGPVTVDLEFWFHIPWLFYVGIEFSDCQVIWTEYVSINVNLFNRLNFHFFLENYTDDIANVTDIYGGNRFEISLKKVYKPKAYKAYQFSPTTERVVRY